jgi:hypothetical protein
MSADNKVCKLTDTLVSVKALSSSAAEPKTWLALHPVLVLRELMQGKQVCVWTTPLLMSEESIGLQLRLELLLMMEEAMLQSLPEVAEVPPSPLWNPMEPPPFSMWILSHSIRQMALQSRMMEAGKLLSELRAIGIASLLLDKPH